MRDAPRLLPWSATRVVRAVRAEYLSAGHKLVWVELWGLARTPRGAWISAVNLAQRLGMSRDTVGTYRRDLERLGLLVKAPARRGETATWRPSLPPDCIPAERPTPREVDERARRLEQYVAGHRSGTHPREVADPGPSLPAHSRRDPPGPGSASREEESQRPPPPPSPPLGRAAAPRERRPLRPDEEQAAAVFARQWEEKRRQGTPPWRFDEGRAEP